MKQSFILMGCLLSIALLQCNSLSADCCGGKKKQRPIRRVKFEQCVQYHGGCGCGGGVGKSGNEIPPNED